MTIQDLAEKQRVSVSDVVTACIYAIATERWTPGDRLPSVRNGSAEFGASQVTVQRAYTQLIQQGLVEAVPRSGVFVRKSEEVSRLCSRQSQLDDVYNRVARVVQSKTDAPTSHVFQQLARIAQLRERDQPEVVFLECTQWQAEKHAREIQTQLGIACATAVIEETRVPGAEDIQFRGVRWVVTTSFHTRVGRRFAETLDATLLTAAIEYAPDSMKKVRKALVLGLDAAQAALVAKDLKRLGDKNVQVESRASSPELVDSFARETLEHMNGFGRIILSTSLWTALSGEMKSHPLTMPYPVQLSHQAMEKLQARLLGVWAGLGQNRK